MKYVVCQRIRMICSRCSITYCIHGRAIGHRAAFRKLCDVFKERKVQNLFENRGDILTFEIQRLKFV